MNGHKGVAIFHEDNGMHSVYVDGRVFASYKSREYAANRARKFSKTMGTPIVHVTEKTLEERKRLKAFKQRGAH